MSMDHMLYFRLNQKKRLLLEPVFDQIFACNLHDCWQKSFPTFVLSFKLFILYDIDTVVRVLGVGWRGSSGPVSRSTNEMGVEV